MRLSLYDRLKPEYKQKIANRYANLPFGHQAIIEALSNEYYFTEIKYGIASEITSSCELNFFGDVFNK